MEVIIEANLVFITTICWVITWLTGVIMTYLLFREKQS